MSVPGPFRITETCEHADRKVHRAWTVCLCPINYKYVETEGLLSQYLRESGTAQILSGLNNKNLESDISGWKLKDQRSRVTSH